MLDHFECDNKACANPTHVRLVTQRENILRSDSLQALNAAKTHCHRGHEFTPENIYERPDGRECRACMAENYLTRDKDKHNEARRHRRAMGARN